MLILKLFSGEQPVTTKREEVRRTLMSLAQAHISAMELMQHTLSLLDDEYALDAYSFWKSRRPTDPMADSFLPVADEKHLEIRYQNKSCFVGNRLPFWLFACLARRPNKFFNYRELFEEVWTGEVRSESAVRAVVKRLRSLLRDAQMPELAAAIDGSEPRHYRLLLPS